MDIDKIKIYVIPLVLGIVFGCLGSYLWNARGDHSQQDNNMSNSTSVLNSTTGVQAHPKESPGDPDVVLSQVYTAVINGEKVSVPVAKTNTNSSSKPSSTPGTALSQTQGVINQSIDLTPLLSKLTPKWEIGAGYMYYDGDHCGLVSFQRNYKKDKALECSFVVSHGKIQGGMVQHKWLIK